MLEKYPDKVQRFARQPLFDAQMCVEHGSDTPAGETARYIVHEQLRVALVMAAGLREIERPIKYWLTRLEKRGIKNHPFIERMYQTPSPAELIDQRIVLTLKEMPLVPPSEKYRVKALFTLRKIDTHISEHWSFPTAGQQFYIHKLNALYLAYLPEAGSA